MEFEYFFSKGDKLDNVFLQFFIELYFSLLLLVISEGNKDK